MWYKATEGPLLLQTETKATKNIGTTPKTPEKSGTEEIRNVKATETKIEITKSAKENRNNAGQQKSEWQNESGLSLQEVETLSYGSSNVDIEVEMESFRNQETTLPAVTSSTVEAKEKAPPLPPFLNPLDLGEEVQLPNFQQGNLWGPSTYKII